MVLAYSIGHHSGGHINCAWAVCRTRPLLACSERECAVCACVLGIGRVRMRNKCDSTFPSYLRLALLLSSAFARAPSGSDCLRRCLSRALLLPSVLKGAVTLSLVAGGQVSPQQGLTNLFAQVRACVYVYAGAGMDEIAHVFVHVHAHAHVHLRAITAGHTPCTQNPLSPLNLPPSYPPPPPIMAFQLVGSVVGAGVLAGIFDCEADATLSLGSNIGMYLQHAGGDLIPL